MQNSMLNLHPIYIQYSPTMEHQSTIVINSPNVSSSLLLMEPSEQNNEDNEQII